MEIENVVEGLHQLGYLFPTLEALLVQAANEGTTSDYIRPLLPLAADSHATLGYVPGRQVRQCLKPEIFRQTDSTVLHDLPSLQVIPEVSSV